jgi:hypothetical protein
MRRVSWISLLPALVLSLTASSAAAAPPWSTAVDISSPSLFVQPTFVGFDSAGDGLTAWTWQQGVGNSAKVGRRFATRPASGAFTPERAVPTPLSEPEIYGRGHVLWRGEQGFLRRGRQFNRVKVAFGRMDGRIGKPRTLETVEIFGPSVADVNDAGQIALAYIRTERGRRRAATLFVGSGRRFGRPRIVSRRGGVNEVTVAVGRRGDIVAAWERGGRIEARIRRPGHRLGRVISLGRGAPEFTELRAAVSSSGRVWVAWSSQALTEGGDNGPFELQVAVSSRTRSIFHRPRLVDRYERRASDEATLDLALDAERKGLIAWSTFDGQNFRARLASLDRGGRSAGFTTLSQPGYDAAVADLATSLRTENDALVVWSRLDTVGEVGTIVFAGYISIAGTYSAEEQLSIGNRARTPVAAFDPRTGLPSAVWSQREGPDGPGVPLDQVQTFVRASTRSP